MEVISLCPLPVAALTWNADKRGWSLTVACKATFRLTAGVLDLATEHLPIARTDRHYDDDAQASVYMPSDLAPFKPNVDVVLVGHAYAPTLVTRLKPRIRIGDVLDKELVIHGDRTRDPDRTEAKTESFDKMPLRYERCTGGDGSDNPVGVPSEGRLADGKRRLANIERPGTSARGRPVGFGPVAPDWPPRREKLGKHAAEWSHDSWYELPLPVDVQLGYFNAAPEDQQVEQLPPAAELVLENLHPTAPHFKTSLPDIRPLAYVERSGMEPELMTMRCDTLWIDTDKQLCTLTWRGQLKLTGPSAPGRCLVVLSEDGTTMTWDDVDELREECDIPPWHERQPDSHIGDEIGLDGKPRDVAAKGRQLHVQVVAGPVVEPAPMSQNYLAPGDVQSIPGPSSAQLRAYLDPPAVSLTKLFWHDGTCVDDLEKQAPWDAVIAGLPPIKSDRERRRLAMQEVLRRGEPVTVDTLEAVFRDAAGEPWYAPPYVVSAGQVAVSYDEVSRLRAAITSAMPHAGGRLREIVSQARELLTLPWLDDAGGIADELVTRIREAFDEAAADAPPGYLDAQIEHMLVADRAYRYITLWGRNWVRASFTPRGARAGIPAYISESAANQLPMFRHFEALVLAAVDLREDQYETHPLALRLCALARVSDVSA